MRLKVTVKIRIGQHIKSLFVELESSGSVADTIKVVERKVLKAFEGAKEFSVVAVNNSVTGAVVKHTISKQEYLATMARDEPEKYREYLNKQMKVCEIQGKIKTSGKFGSIGRRKGE